MASIDFRGKDGALGAYEAAAIDTWAVFNKKNIMQSGTGLESLTGYLDLMEQHGGNTVYTLKLYKHGTEDDIVDNTPCNSSFNFNLVGGGMGGYSQGVSAGNSNFGLLQRIAGLEQKLKDAEKPEKEPSIGSTVLGWFQEPDDVVKIIGAIKMLFGKNTPEQTMQLVSSLGGVEPKRAQPLPSPVKEVLATAEPLADGLTAEQEQALYRYANVIDKGEKADPEFLQHMEGLVKLATENPAMYKMGLGFLK